MSSSFTYSGEGEALVVREKCNALKTFTSSYTYTCGNDFCDLSIINYQNSIIGKKLLSAVFDISTNIEYSSNGLLNFRANYYDVDGIFYIILFITGVHKKCNYSSFEIDFAVPSATNSALLSKLKAKAKSADEFHKLLESNSGLKKSFLKLKAKSKI
jgi:hypothetical protein